MKIGFIYTSFYPLGSSASVHGYQLVKGLNEKGHEVLCLGGANPVTVNYPRNVRGAWQLMRAADVLYIRINPYLVNDWFTLAHWLPGLRKPVVWEINAPVEEVYSGYYPEIPASVETWVKRQNRKRTALARGADAAIGVSTVLADYARDQLGIREVACIPNGSDPTLFQPGRVDASHPLFPFVKDKFVVVWAGNAGFSWQGTSMIIDTARQMREKDPDVVFLIISNKSLYSQAILPNVLSLAEIQYLKLPEFLKAGDIALCLYNPYDWCPYGFYNSPLKLYDFMSMGLPVIGSDMGQIAEVITPGREGLLTSGSIEEITDHILYLKHHREKRLEMGIHARNKIVGQYNWAQVADQTEAVLKSCVS